MSHSLSYRVLLLGGTGEATDLAERLAALPEFEVVYSLAGRVAEPRLPSGTARVGGFGGQAALAEWLRVHRIDAVVDATHPFAERITESAVAAAASTGVDLLLLRRPGWQQRDGDDWSWVPSLAAAAEAIPATANRVLLTTGRQDAAAFADLDRHEFVLRCVQPPDPPLPPRLEVLLDCGPYTVDSELRLLRDKRIDLLVTKDSGGEQTEAKLTACRELDIPVIIVRRPPAPDAPAVTTALAAVDWLRGQAAVDVNRGAP